MAEIKVTHEDFTMTSYWTCTTKYSYSSSGSFLSAENTPGGVGLSMSNEQFLGIKIPAGCKVVGAKVHAAHTGGLYGGEFFIDDKVPDDNGFVTLESPDFSSGSFLVKFNWKSNTDGTDAHTGSYPAFDGATVKNVKTSHTSTTDVTDVYLLIETERAGSIIYRAEDDKLVPYKLYHAEDGSLVPYQLLHAEDGSLVHYGE